MKKTRKGFTLVELLIVVAIIGVLAAMMTLSSSDATIAARAASIANGYKIIGSAFTVYKAVSGDEATADYFNTTVSGDYVGPQTKLLGKYKVFSDDSQHFYVSFDFDDETNAKAKFLTYSKDMGMKGSRMKIY